MKEKNNEFILDKRFFNDSDAVEARINNVEKAYQGKLRTVLRYLYLDGGPKNLSRIDQLRPVERFLSLAEIKVARWLSTLTNGTRSRKIYGINALNAFKVARGKCLICHQPDVRTLEIDHSNDVRSAESPQQCICANCHKVETYNRSFKLKSGELGVKLSE